MEDEKKKASWADLVLYFLAVCALGSIIATPWQIASLERTIEEGSIIYFAVEACKLGVDLDACERLSGKDGGKPE